MRELLLVENAIPLVDAFLLGIEEGVGRIEDFDFLDGVAHADRVDHILALRGDTKDRVASVQVRSGHMGDEKLATVCSRTRICHGENAWLVVHETGFDLVLEAVARTSTASAGWVAALDHKLRNHAVEGNAIVVAAFGEVATVTGAAEGLRVASIGPLLVLTMMRMSCMEAVSVAEWAVIVKPRSRAEKIRFIRKPEYDH